MRKIEIEEVPTSPHPMGVNTDRRHLSESLGTDDVALVHYLLAPGEQFSGGLHSHSTQEEIFYIIQGSATFEHGIDGAETETVSAGEMIRFSPGEFQCGRNESDEPTVALAVASPGAHHDWDDLETPVYCDDCETVTLQGIRPPDDGMVVYCLECSGETRLGESEG